MKSAELILASASAGRAAILRGAKLPFRQEPAVVDERALEAGAAASGARHADAGGLALLLAAAKAKDVSTRHAEALVLGTDQVMDCEGVLQYKPPARRRPRAALGLARPDTYPHLRAVRRARRPRALAAS